MKGFGVAFFLIMACFFAFTGYQMYIGFQLQQACLATKDLKSFECRMIGQRQSIQLDVE
jgi:hypothetical protein